MNYREATQADWEGVAALHAKSWQTAYRGALRDDFLDGPVVDNRRARWQQRFSEPAPNQFVVLAEDDDGSLVGFACAYGADHAELGTLLDNLHVLPDRQGQGIGRQLVGRVAAWSLANYPACALYLDVLEVNERAQRFYQRLGGEDGGGATWNAPDGESRAVRHYVWPIDKLAALAGVA